MLKRFFLLVFRCTLVFLAPEVRVVGQAVQGILEGRFAVLAPFGRHASVYTGTAIALLCP
jgi:hypothetical protein